LLWTALERVINRLDRHQGYFLQKISLIRFAQGKLKNLFQLPGDPNPSLHHERINAAKYGNHLNARSGNAADDLQFLELGFAYTQRGVTDVLVR
jgi:hypothetical protein